MQKGMKRIAKVGLKKVLRHIGEPVYRLRAQHYQSGHWQTYRLKLSNARMMLFGKHQECQCCGLKGRYFWLEHSGCFSPHLNMYGVNRHGKEIMLTMDHIDPRSNGGTTSLDNLQVLCQRCNKIKKHLPLTLEELRQRVFPHDNDHFGALVQLWERTYQIEDQKEFALAIVGKTEFSRLLFLLRKKLGTDQTLGDLRELWDNRKNHKSRKKAIRRRYIIKAQGGANGPSS